MKSRPDRAGRDIEHLGRLVERKAKVVMKHENGPLTSVETAKASLELIAVGQVALHLRWATR